MIDRDTWLNGIEDMAFDSELEKLADSPIYPEEHNRDEYEDLEPMEEEQEGEGYEYHSNEPIMRRNNKETANELVGKNKRRRIQERVKKACLKNIKERKNKKGNNNKTRKN